VRSEWHRRQCLSNNETDRTVGQVRMAQSYLLERPIRPPKNLGRHVTTEELADGKLEKVLAALDANWQAEMEGHWTYQTLADRDSDPVRAQVLRHLAGGEWEHAALWAGHIRELNGLEPVCKGSQHGDADSFANRAGGIQMALRRLEIDESRDIAKYGEQLKGLGDAGSIAILNHVIEDDEVIDTANPVVRRSEMKARYLVAAAKTSIPSHCFSGELSPSAAVPHKV